MGTTTNAIPVRLERGEPADVLIMVGYALGDLIKQGKVVADSRVDLVKSPIGIAVKSGAPKPDIGLGRQRQAGAAGGQVRRLFRQRQRRLCLDRVVRQARDRRSDEGQGADDPGDPGRRDRRQGRSRDRPAADLRVEAGCRHRHRRSAAGAVAEDHGVLRRDRDRLEGARCRQGADQLPCLVRMPATRWSTAGWIRSRAARRISRRPSNSFPVIPAQRLCRWRCSLAAHCAVWASLERRTARLVAVDPSRLRASARTSG